tara:strand:+ start:15415 stop:15807 length:393 start_codon:yes stop_codon:yes gene_type:complete
MKNIWVNGCFDILHIGHLEMLQFARSLGDNLRVGIDSDDKVKIDKGLSRPFNTQQNRKSMLEGFSCVDEVVIFNTPKELEDMVKEYSPEAMVVGSDWREKPVIGSSHTNEVVYFDRIGDHSTTAILERQK